MVSLERMAEVLDTTPEKVRDIGLSMGLPPHVTPPAEYQQRGYISIIRRNWHLLPYEQLLRIARLGRRQARLHAQRRRLSLDQAGLSEACLSASCAMPSRTRPLRNDASRSRPLSRRSSRRNSPNPARRDLTSFAIWRLPTPERSQPPASSSGDAEEDPLPLLLLRPLRRSAAQPRTGPLSGRTAPAVVRSRRQRRLAARGAASACPERDLSRDGRRSRTKDRQFAATGRSREEIRHRRLPLYERAKGHGGLILSRQRAPQGRSGRRPFRPCALPLPRSASGSRIR